jgi:hypothetical protein
MTLCDYQVVEYAPTELHAKGTVFAVALRVPAANSFKLLGFVLSDWEESLPVSSLADISDLRSFISDFSYHCEPGKPAHLPFFQSLRTLNVGAIRTGAFGSCKVADLDEVLPTILNRKRESLSWDNSFCSSPTHMLFAG